MALVQEYLEALPIEIGVATGEIRRKATRLAQSVGFNPIKTEEIAIIVNEMLSNVKSYGGGTGVLFISKISDDSLTGIELCCCDFGDGISADDLVLQDGFSQGNSLGIGLGAIKRLSDEFSLNPRPLPGYIQSVLPDDLKLGVSVFVRKWLPACDTYVVNPRIQIGVATQAHPGEIFNGDGWLVTHSNPGISVVAVMDGLGHGTAAHWAAEIAKESIYLGAGLPLEALINQAHHALKSTRGATIAIARLDTAGQKLSFTGVGNIESFLISKKRKQSLLSMNGIVGHNMRKTRFFCESFLPGDSIVLFSDGISSHLAAGYQNWQLTPQQIANEMLHEFSKSNDDATILIARYID